MHMGVSWYLHSCSIHTILLPSFILLGLHQMKDWVRELELPSTSPVHGFRQMTDVDVPEVTRLLNEYLSTSPVKLAPVFSEADVRHLFVFQEGVVCSYVLDKAADGKADGAPILTDFLSFYHLPSSIMKHATEKKLHAVYSFYNVANTMTFTELMNDSLILAKHSQNADVFNCLDVMKNREVLEPLKFGKGDGCLQVSAYF